MVTITFGFDEALQILLPCEIHSFFLTHHVVSKFDNTIWSNSGRRAPVAGDVERLGEGPEEWSLLAWTF
jgi:hypothetical protein